MYDKAYFDNYHPPYNENEAHWGMFFGAIADYITLVFNPVTVLDVGCAKGFLVGELRKRDVLAWGIDSSVYAIRNATREAAPYVSIHSATDKLRIRYDVITCIEVLEHIQENEALKALDNICAHADRVLFSSTSTDVDEPTHINVHSQRYWIEQFVKRGFLREARNEPNHLIPWVMVWQRQTSR